ncbi:MAG: phage holin, LLH family [Vulcanimicrobiota bacterium]
MFSFLNNAQRTLHELETLITLAEQVVLALEQTANSSGQDKKRMALQMLVDLAHSHGLDPPVLLLDTAIEAAVRLTH